MAQLVAFLGIAILVIVTPGQDTALTMRNTLLGGRRAGVFTAAGIAAGRGITWAARGSWDGWNRWRRCGGGRSAISATRR